MARGVAAALVALLLAPALPAAAAALETIDLRLHPRLEWANATLLLGHLELNPGQIQHPGAVGATRLDLPPGTLTVCPLDRGARGVVPTLQALEGTCRGGTAFDDPQMRFGARTWLQFAGNYTPVAPNASVSLLVPAGSATRWLLVPAPAEVAMAIDDDDLRFNATVASSEVIVESGGRRTWFNGTQHGFLFEGQGLAVLRAAGVHAQVPTRFGITLTEADPAALAAALNPRVLLDLQEALLGPAAREPVRNVTRLFGDVGRVPHLVNGALLGHVNGTIGQRVVEAGGSTVARTQRLDATVTGPSLQGSGEVRFLRAGGSLVLGGRGEATPPWGFAVVLWLIAAAAIALRPRPPWLRSWRRAGDWSAPFALAFGVDATLAAFLGVSGLGLALGGGPLPATVALLAFEAAMLALVMAILYAPLRIATGRAFPRRLQPLAAPASLLVVLLHLVLVPGAAIALGLLVARL